MTGMPPSLEIARIDLSRPPRGEPELNMLASLHGAGVDVAPITVVPPAEQEAFYRHANLVARLGRLFAGVDPADPDEDDLEELAPEATALVLDSFLLDEAIDRIYDSLISLPASLRVRRPGAAGMVVPHGRPVLLAIKRIWAEDWSLGALRSRLAATRSFALEARPVLLHEADNAAGPAVLKRLAGIIGPGTDVFLAPGGEVTRLAATD